MVVRLTVQRWKRDQPGPECSPPTGTLLAAAGRMNATRIALTVAGVLLPLAACGSSTTSTSSTSDSGLSNHASDAGSEDSSAAKNPAGCPPSPPEYNSPCAPDRLECYYGHDDCGQVTSALCEGGRWNMPSSPSCPNDGGLEQ